MVQKVRRVGIHEAKTHLSRLLREVERGAEIIVERGGQPIARITGAGNVVDPARSYGMFAGQFVVGNDFDADQEQLADDFGIP